MFSYLVRANPFGALSSNSNPEYFCNTSQSPSAFNSSTILYVGGATTKGALNSTLPCWVSIFFNICANIFISPLCTIQDPTKPKSTFLVPP